ncbi:MAG: hypothetical protein JWP12_3656 [Bacteroidetes bacterium]|nr:hypothetical protein [Bacteroidota bacterium]
MNIQEYIASGILEMYVLGDVTPEEAMEVEKLASVHEEIRTEIDEISNALQQYAAAQTAAPHPAIKPFLIATIDYMERMQNGEQPAFPPVLNTDSKMENYSQWINRPDMVIGSDFQEMKAKIIGYTPEVITAIVWIKTMAPHEVHDNEFEKFLILEGTCDIIFGDKKHSLKAGDYFSIPLHTEHHLIVTSSIPCKAILQRIAA